MLKINTTSKYAELKFDDKSDLYPLNEISYTVENESETVSFYNRFYNKIVTEQLSNIQVNDVPVTRDNIQDLLSVLFAGYEGSGGSVDLSNYYTKPEANTLLDNKVDKVDGKQLSTEDYTTEEKTKLESLHNYDDTTVKADIASNTAAIEAEVVRAKAAEKVNADAISALDTAYKTADATIDTKIDAEVTRATNAESELNTKIETKGDKVSGKGLSTEDYTTAEKSKLASLSNYDDSELRNLIGNTYTKSEVDAKIDEAVTGGEVDLSNYYTKYETDSKVSGKVDKVEGKGLSTNDFTTALKTKLEGLTNYDDSDIRNIITNIQNMVDYTLIEQTVSGTGILALSNDRLQHTIINRNTTISLPTVTKYTVIDFSFTVNSNYTVTFPSSLIWKAAPSEFTDGVEMEFLFTYNNNKWYGAYIAYGNN